MKSSSSHHNIFKPVILPKSMEDKYIFFDKTADAKFQAFGVTIEDAFKNAVEAMVSIMFNLDELRSYDIHTEERELMVEADNLEGLLYRFLEEVIFLLSAESFIGLVKKISIEKNDEGYTVKAKIHGTQSINLESHGEVKAVTYNEMFVKLDEEKGRYIVQVVVDL
jgi:SHS2 domain-containing protein